MSTQPTQPGEPEVDDETCATLDERLKTIERDSNDVEEWTPELKERRIRQLQSLVPGEAGKVRRRRSARS